MKSSTAAHRNILRLLVALLLILPAAASPALAAGDNDAVAINTEDGSSLFRFAFEIHRTVNQTIDETNIAISYASCESCQTVAIAIQIVLVASDPNVITPQNVSIAVNEECTSCETMAFAYQFVTGTGEPLKIDSEGRRKINEVRKAFLDLAKAAEAGELSAAEIEARVTELVDELRVVVRDHVVPAGTPDVQSNGKDGTGSQGEDGTSESELSDADPDPTPPASPSASSTPQASASATASPSPTATSSS